MTMCLTGHLAVIFLLKNNEEEITKTLHSFIVPSDVLHKEQMLNEVFTLANIRRLIAMLVLGTALSIFKLDGEA